MALAAIALGAVLLPLAACRSYWINASIENQSGQLIRELEVDYPSASFGADSLAPGATMHYRFQIRGSGPLHVQYSIPGGSSAHADGLSLKERQHGQVTIRLLPQGKVQFLPALQPAS
jgi:hypothetical protein